jgi:hypothetical protein
MKLQRVNLTTFSIVEDGLMSSESLAEGRFIPVIVIDVQGNKEIEELIKLHNNIVSGDVTMTWAKDFYSRKKIIFRLAFHKPMEVVFGIEFKLDSDYSIIDGMIESKGLALQTGKKGEKVSSKLEDPKILIEVPEMGFKEKWNEMLLSTVRKNIRKKGASKRESLVLAKNHIVEMRKFWKMRR